MPGHLFDAVFPMVFRDRKALLIGSNSNCSHVRQHVVVLASFLPQPFEALSRASNTCEPRGDILARWIVSAVEYTGHNFF